MLIAHPLGPLISLSLYGQTHAYSIAQFFMVTGIKKTQVLLCRITARSCQKDNEMGATDYQQ